ncbi:MAG: CBS domain-containing protein [Planctomycetaceae bacterium]
MRITVRDLMVPAAAVTSGDATIAAARRAMLRGHAEEAYVVDDDGTLRGVVPDYEFLKAELCGVDGKSPVSSLVSAKVEAVEADADVSTTLAKFREGWCGRVAVVEDGRLVGRLTRSEVLRLVLHLRDTVEVTEATAEPTLAGPHFHRRRDRLSPVRKTSPTAGARSGRKVRRLAAS